MLTLFHPENGVVIVKGTLKSTNAIIHPWLKDMLGKILDSLPPKERQASPQVERALWKAWQENVGERFTLPETPPPLRLLLVLDNLTGHKSHDLILWFYNHGVMPLFTPLGGSWLNMAESMQRILKRRGAQWSDARDASRHHALARRRSRRLEQRSDALCLGRQTDGTAPSRTPAALPGGRLSSLRYPPNQASRRTLMRYMSKGTDPLVPRQARCCTVRLAQVSA